MKKKLRLLIRRIIGTREFETISDSINRKKLNFLKKINKKTFNLKDFEKSLVSIGLKEGDCVIVHSSWRAFIGFTGKPEDIIESILKIIGSTGTLIMPCFGINNNEFHYDDVSNAGIISEIFRKRKGTIRSLNSTFSMCAYGKYAAEIINDHINSNYCFDEKSPYSKAITLNSKILLLGLGKKPHKITLFHCVTYSLKNDLECYKKAMKEHKKNPKTYTMDEVKKELGL